MKSAEAENNLHKPENTEDITKSVLERIRGKVLEANLLTLAKIGGTKIEPTPDQPERYAVDRLALSAKDEEARATVIKPWMEEAGMTIQEHPLGLIGTFPGTDPTLSPLVILSHTDSVPKADMYDGTVGVMGGIEVVKAIRQAKIKPRRSIVLISLTGEESSGFGFALFGSRGMFHGLTERELNSKNPEGESIRDVLGLAKTELVKNPIFGPKGNLIPTPYAVIELHVEQDDKLVQRGVDLGIVEAIASPVRYQVQIGDSALQPDIARYPHTKYLKLQVKGKAGHSGATPMGEENRADGLVATAQYLLPLIEQQIKEVNNSLTIGDITVENQAINKIPGITTTNLRLTGSSEDEIEDAMRQLKSQIAKQNQELAKLQTKFDESPLSLEEVKPISPTEFFNPQEVRERQKTALKIVNSVNQTATAHAGEKVVGTVGTYALTSEGKIVLGVDIRGIEKTSRNQAIKEIQQETSVNFGEQLPGSGDPVVLDSDLVRIAKETIEKFDIGSSTVMHSSAGHDSQNAARAGIPTVMIFCQSNNGGIAHHPDAYTNPKNLEKGVRALTALVLRLAI